jgi:hypothetical protein
VKPNILSNHINDFKTNSKKFIVALKLEGKETQDAFKLLYGHMMYDYKMNELQKEWVGNQFKDVLKTIGLTTIALMPGGIIVAIIIKALKIQKHILPSSFEYIIKDKDI